MIRTKSAIGAQQLLILGSDYVNRLVVDMVLRGDILGGDPRARELVTLLLFAKPHAC